MAEIQVIEGDFIHCSGRYALVVGRFNGFVVESLVDGALDTLTRHGIADEDIVVIRVPGAYEMPLAVKRVAETGITTPLSPWALLFVVARRTLSTLPAKLPVVWVLSAWKPIFR